MTSQILNRRTAKGCQQVFCVFRGTITSAIQKLQQTVYTVLCGFGEDLLNSIRSRGLITRRFNARNKGKLLTCRARARALGAADSSACTGEKSGTKKDVSDRLTRRRRTPLHSR